MRDLLYLSLLKVAAQVGKSRLLCGLKCCGAILHLLAASGLQFGSLDLLTFQPALPRSTCGRCRCRYGVSYFLEADVSDRAHVSFRVSGTHR